MDDRQRVARGGRQRLGLRQALRALTPGGRRSARRLRPQSVRLAREHVFVSKYAPRGAPDRTTLERLASRGATLREIAAALDRSIATVRYWLRRWEIARPDARRTRVDPATAPREIMRVCSRHRRAVFRLDARGTYRCVLCAQERVAERRRRIKLILVEEAGGCCAACGYDRLPAALQFHHVNAADKSFGLSARGLSRGIEQAREEAPSASSCAATAMSRWRLECGSRRLPGVDSNHQELINSQSCCRYITGERRCRA